MLMNLVSFCLKFEKVKLSKCGKFKFNGCSRRKVTEQTTSQGRLNRLFDSWPRNKCWC